MYKDKKERVYAFTLEERGDRLFCDLLIVSDNVGTKLSKLTDGDKSYEIRLPDNCLRQDFPMMMFALLLPYKKL